LEEMKRMRARVIYSDFNAHLKIWYRSKGTLFWSIFFPVLLMFLFGAIFSGMGEADLSLHVQDLDDSEISQQFVESLSGPLRVNDIPTDAEIYEHISEEGLRAVLVIPEGFGETIAASFMGGLDTTNLTLFLDQTQTTTNSMLQGIIEGIGGRMNAEITKAAHPGAHDTIILPDKPLDIVQEKLKFIDFFLPGVIGMSVMTSTVYGTIFRNTKYREDGILRKLTTTPMKRSEWLLAMMLFMTVTSLVSTVLIIMVGVLGFGVTIKLNPVFPVIIVSAAFAFAGIGMIISRFVHEEETADSAGGAVTFPMMFLAGTFFPLEMMPEYLRTIARFLPLYYVNEGLRDSMIFADLTGALANAAVVLSLAVAFFVLGVWLTKWKE
jgi:ABC-2 type transport system permease protein